MVTGKNPVTKKRHQLPLLEGQMVSFFSCLFCFSLNDSHLPTRASGYAERLFKCLGAYQNRSLRCIVLCLPMWAQEKTQSAGFFTSKHMGVWKVFPLSY